MLQFKNELKFHSPLIEDKDWVTELLSKSQYQGCEYSFGNIFIWSPIYKNNISRYKDFFLSKNVTDSPAYSFPAGEGDFKEVIGVLMDDAEKCGHSFKMFGLTKKTAGFLDSLMPDMFDFHPYREGFDYIYNSEDLINLSGRKYHSKRNHISNFENDYNWTYEDINKENICDCFAMNVLWENENRLKNPEGIDNELVAVKRAFSNYFELGFKGGMIKADGKVVSYTLGEQLNNNTFCLHIEKAFSDMNGGYAMINREFAKHNLSGYEYVNREEDMGVPGLRKSKLSYHPAILLEKYTAVCRGSI